MAGRYAVTFSDSLSSLDEALSKIRSLGIEVSSVQKVLGTAIVEVHDEGMLDALNSLDEVDGVAAERGYKIV